ncbi:hypothetical protein F0U60_06535 [Archangium minus]|uniref:JAB domain-containing protein n=1 Tax=Archangium minus TaxID=83450 RepID=A0ABY9WKV9_9BACT|nr:hypothetical protein F0U60_06535 [Archangium minus]
MRYLHVLVLTLAAACSGPRRYYLHTELPKLEGNLLLAVVPGPWPEVPTVISDTASIPDDLVLPTLTGLMNLPGASDACDPNTRRPRQDASEYCAAIYRTPQDWRVSWPIRQVFEGASSCQPPFGGVDDSDFGRDVPVLGYAHNHPCGSGLSSQDLSVWPMLKTSEGSWVMVAYGVSPSGRVLRDAQGELIPAWGWLATGHKSQPRFYKWNQEGKVWKWNENEKRWEFQTTCRPRSSSILSPKGVLPDCSPEMR